MTKLNPDPSRRPQSMSALQLNLTLRGTQSVLNTMESLFCVVYKSAPSVCYRPRGWQSGHMSQCHECVTMAERAPCHDNLAITKQIRRRDKLFIVYDTERGKKYFYVSIEPDFSHLPSNQHSAILWLLLLNELCLFSICSDQLKSCVKTSFLLLRILLDGESALIRSWEMCSLDPAMSWLLLCK